MVGARVRRQQVAYAQGRGLSGRRACALLSVARSTLGYVSRLIAKDAPVVPAMRTLAGQYPRYGYRTIRIFLERQGHGMSADRMYRLWRQEALQVPEEAAAPTRRHQPPAAAAADGGQSRLGVRLRVRHVRRRPHAEVSDGHRRVHAGMPGHRRRGRHSVGPSDRGADAARERAWRAALSALRQRPRVRRDGRFSAGCRPPRSRRRSSTRASRGRTAPTNRSTGSSATSTCRCSGSATARTRR